MAIKIFTILIFSILFVLNCSADTLIRHPDVSEQAFIDYLGSQPELDSFKKITLTESDYLDYPLTKLFSEWDTEVNAVRKRTLFLQIQENLGKGFLSVQKRQLWKELYNPKLKSTKNDTEMELQIGILTDKNNLFHFAPQRNYLKLIEYNLSKDSDVFINGWHINNDERKQVILDKKLLYHFFIASNSQIETVALSKPENFRPTSEDLVKGTCEHPIFNPKIKHKNERILALFPYNCLEQVGFHAPNNSFKSPEDLNFESAKTGNGWKQSKVIYALIFVGGIVLYNEFRDYRIRITLPF